MRRAQRINGVGCGVHGCRSLVERALCARLVYQRAAMARAISFEYLNRQLVWHELSELLLFVLPLVNLLGLSRFIAERLPRISFGAASPGQRSCVSAPDKQDPNLLLRLPRRTRTLLSNSVMKWVHLVLEGGTRFIVSCVALGLA
jgi:Pex2 / Pex12 amino terminal region